MATYGQGYDTGRRGWVGDVVESISETYGRVISEGHLYNSLGFSSCMTRRSFYARLFQVGASSHTLSHVTFRIQTSVICIAVHTPVKSKGILSNTEIIFTDSRSVIALHHPI